MKALILNSGLGKRMGNITREQPKCLTELLNGETILERQLRLLCAMGITEVIITTGKFSEMIESQCRSLQLPLKYVFVENKLCEKTNYIYSIYLAREFLTDDIILLHGDLVFEYSVIKEAVNSIDSCMIVSSDLDIPEKDFKAAINKDGTISAIGVEFFEDVIAAQPLYKLNKKDWSIWKNQIIQYCEDGKVDCYAENAYNDIAYMCNIKPLDIKSKLCREIDNIDDLEKVNIAMRDEKNKTVYMCFSTDVIHSGHIALIRNAAKLGKLIIGVLSDEATASYKRYPMLPYKERKNLFENLVGVYKVVEQKELSYRENLELIKPDYVVHGDDWKYTVQKPVRDEVISILNQYGGELVEYPYSIGDVYTEIDRRSRIELGMPDVRRGRLRKLITMKGLVNAIEAHSGLTGLIAENTVVHDNGKTYQFDAIWISSLCDSTAKGKPDIELVDMTSRFRTIDDIMEVTTKPIIFDGDTGGLTEHFVYTVRTLERMGVSMIIIEDKTGLKKNSLFGVEALQVQDSIENFCTKISEGKKAQRTSDFMIVARIESLILEMGMDDALNRAFAYVAAGADGIMIHSRKKEPDEIFEFVRMFREKDKDSPIIVVPTSYNQVTEAEFKEKGVNIVIYANQLIRSGFPAMQKTAETILKNHRAKEADEYCMSINEILTLIPDEI